MHGRLYLVARPELQVGGEGETGETGGTGETGETRETGETGDTGDTGDNGEMGEMGETMMTTWMRVRVSMHWRGVGDDWVIVEDEVVPGWVRPMGEATEVVATKMTFHENNKDNKDKRERNQNTISVTPKENRLTNPFLISRTTLFRYRPNVLSNGVAPIPVSATTLHSPVPHDTPYGHGPLDE